MLKLKNVSKFYYNKGVIASGFSKINLELNMGEFVVITGESGSGKSTLLNVLSGLDTYEEGEMYVNGEETSHYGETEAEEYRKKYIGNIFQYFYLVNSYTVYQNIELVLLLNGYKKHEVKEKIIELIKKVDLYRFRNTKVSKLSGGQKQRVAIARALAKDTPIIVADEPTGNLDSKSALSVMRILSEISKDKLVIVVTHNYDQVKEYATRKIKMHDGKIIEDKVLKETKILENPKPAFYKGLSFANKIRLGLRNTFNIFPKFLLMFIVYLFVVLALFFEYSSYTSQEYEYSISGSNQFFNDTSDARIIIKKNDKTSFSIEDYNKIKTLNNIDHIVENDLLIDNDVNLTNDNYYLYGSPASIKDFKGNLDKGRMPENDFEVVVVGSPNDYYLSTEIDGVLKADLCLSLTGKFLCEDKYRVVGVQYTKEDNYYSTNAVFYLSDQALEQLKFDINVNYSNFNITFNGKIYDSTAYSTIYRVVPSSKVGKGSVIISDDLKYECKRSNCKNYEIKIGVNNIYYTDELVVKVSDYYTSKNFQTKTGLKDYDSYVGSIFISNEDYDKLFTRDPYQSSIFLKDVKKKDETITSLNEMGITTLNLSETLVSEDFLQILKIFKLVAIVIIVVVLFFIAYFVLKIILKSRNVYFSTIRILGSSKQVSRDLLNIELIAIANLAYLVFLTFIILVKQNVLEIEQISKLINYLTIKDFAILYVVLIVMSLLLAHRFARKLFKLSAITTYYEEV